MSDKPRHPFLVSLDTMPERFPELKGNDQLAQIARLIVLPALKVGAKKDPEGARRATVAFLARFVRGLEIAPNEIYPELAQLAELEETDVDDETAPVPATAATADPTPTTLTKTPLDKILAGDA